MACTHICSVHLTRRPPCKLRRVYIVYSVYLTGSVISTANFIVPIGAVLLAALLTIGAFVTRQVITVYTHHPSV
jgi:hypothetical protein